MKSCHVSRKKLTDSYNKKSVNFYYTRYIQQKIHNLLTKCSAAFAAAGHCTVLTASAATANAVDAKPCNSLALVKN